jgi:hypothetical protein
LEGLWWGLTPVPATAASELAELGATEQISLLFDMIPILEIEDDENELLEKRDQKQDS